MSGEIKEIHGSNFMTTGNAVWTPVDKKTGFQHSIKFEKVVNGEPTNFEEYDITIERYHQGAFIDAKTIRLDKAAAWAFSAIIENFV